jgi:PEP-CTERM motif-containing protein
MVLNKGTFAVALILASLIGTTADPAQAAYIITFSETGNDVTASGSGAIDLAGLTFITSGATLSEVAPTFATEATGAAGDVDEYLGVSGPFSFGPGVFTSATTGNGDLVGVQVLRADPPEGFIFVPMGYASGAPLSDTATYAGQSFATLGLTPGVYLYTFGSGTDADSFTIKVGAPVPEPSTWAMMLLGFAGLGVVGYRQTRRAKPQAA